MSIPQNPSSTDADAWLYMLFNALQAHAAQGNQTIQIHCMHTEANNHDIQVPSHRVWSPMLLASIAAYSMKDIYIPIRSCDECNTYQTHLDKTLAAFKHLQSAMGVHVNIYVNEQPKAETKPLPSPDKTISRRTFFRTVIPSMAKQAGENIARLTREQPSDALTFLAHDQRNIPTLSKIFLYHLPKLTINHTPIPAIPELELGNIQASEACTACGECVSHCPSQALSLRPFGQRYILEFQANCCTGCNQCVETCPQGAMENLPSINLPALLQDKPRPLVMVYPLQPGEEDARRAS